MSFDSLLRQQLEVHRVVTTTDPATYDELGQPLTEEAPVVTVPGLIQPRDVREMEILSHAGAEVSSHIGYLRPLAGLGPDSWIVADGVRYDLAGLPDAGGQGHHLELPLQAVS